MQENCFGKEKLYPFAFFRMSNLFMSYLNHTTEQADAFKLLPFLNLYTGLYEEETNIADSAPNLVFGDGAVEKLLEHGILWRVNWAQGKLVFFKQST